MLYFIVLLYPCSLHIIMNTFKKKLYFIDDKENLIALLNLEEKQEIYNNLWNKTFLKYTLTYGKSE